MISSFCGEGLLSKTNDCMLFFIVYLSTSTFFILVYSVDTYFIAHFGILLIITSNDLILDSILLDHWQQVKYAAFGVFLPY